LLQESSCYRPCRRSTSSFLDSVRYAHDTFSKNPSTSAGVRITNEELPTKEQLFYVDFLTDTLKLGSCIYENSDVIVVLWRIMTIKLYHQQTDIVEGALDIHLDKDGRIYKIKNRPVTRDDQNDASSLSKLKEASKTENGEGQQ
uniref:C2 tensin-type domain-containing protein n=1 Tax=Brugia timori TaxID=42155 RepID=A0A0R3R910_9BILA